MRGSRTFSGGCNFWNFILPQKNNDNFSSVTCILHLSCYVLSLVICVDEYNLSFNFKTWSYLELLFFSTSNTTRSIWQLSDQSRKYQPEQLKWYIENNVHYFYEKAPLTVLFYVQMKVKAKVRNKINALLISAAEYVWNGLWFNKYTLFQCSMLGMAIVLLKNISNKLKMGKMQIKKFSWKHMYYHAQMTRSFTFSKLN